MSEGIRDKVVILGMGCTRFGERWDDGPEDLAVEAFTECLEDAQIEKRTSRRPGWAATSTRSTSARAAIFSG